MHMQNYDENTITRVLTNEFLFYTKHLLTLNEFQILQQRIANLVKIIPENFHLILGSFAILTTDNKVMNVVPHIQSGKNPVIDFASVHLYQNVLDKLDSIESRLNTAMITNSPTLKRD